MFMKKKEMLKEQKRLKEQKKEKMLDFNDKDDIKKIVYISLGVVIFIGLVFVLINLFNGTWNLFSRKNDDPTSIDGYLLMCGTIFNKTDDEYLVLAYDIKNDDESIYGVLMETYKGDLPIYYLDLKSGFNKTCLGDKNNFVNDSTKIKFASSSLLHIKDGKIIKSYTTKEQIKSYLMKEK